MVIFGNERKRVKEGTTRNKNKSGSHSSGMVAAIFLACLFNAHLFAQTVQVGTVADETSRSLQLLGKIDSAISFTVRPLHTNEALTPQKLYSLIDPADKTSYAKPFRFAGKLGQVSLLPVTITQQYDTHHPYGWNDGALTPSAGYQVLMSAGVYASFGPLSVQLNPEFVYAQAKAYETTSIYGDAYAAPYKRIYPGQSSIRLNAGAVSAGVSTENLWWGPGINSSLLMSNTAPGFGHIFLNSRRPLRTGIGSFEWQLIAGKLDYSDNLPYDIFNLQRTNSLPKDWRYLNGLVVTYQPKWLPHLYLGLSRVVQTYSSNLEKTSNAFERYLPVIALAVQKSNVNNDEGKERDQIASFFLRWVLPKAHMELYSEYGFNDYGVNVRDYVMAPTHSAAYIVGVKKIFPLADSVSRFEVGAELTQMSESPDYLVRGAGNWYTHFQILHGYTNDNQIMGAGAGLGCNVQTITAKWIRGWKQLGIIMERVEHDPLNHPINWVDFSVGVVPQFKYRNLVLGGKLQFINRTQYAWLKDENRFNLHAKLMLQYLF